MQLRKDLIKLPGGSLLCPPSCPIYIRFRSEDLPERAIVLMPDMIEFASRNLKLWLIALGGLLNRGELDSGAIIRKKRR
jgi:hypothetical protein